MGFHIRPPPMFFTKHETRNTNHGFFRALPRREVRFRFVPLNGRRWFDDDYSWLCRAVTAAM